MITQIAGGRFEDWMKGNRDMLAKAVTYAIGLAGKGAKEDFRQDLMRTGYKAVLGNLVGNRTYPNGGKVSVGAATLIEARGDRAQTILSNFIDGAVITPKKGKYLAVPTRWNRVSGRRGQPFLVSPEQMIASHQSFTTRARKGTGVRIWYLRVNAAQATTGKKRMQAMAGGLIKVGATAKRTRERLQIGVVPMFVLIPQTKMPRIFNASGTLQKWADAVPDLIERALPGN